MDRGLAVLLTAVVGGILALQAPINAGLGRATGSIAAALVSFTVGATALVVVVAVSGESGGLTSTFARSLVLPDRRPARRGLRHHRAITVKSIGAGGVAVATVTVQLTAAVVIDRLGLFGLEHTSPAPP